VKRKEKTINILKEKDKEIQSLEEQIRELEFHLKTQKKVKKSILNQEISSGQLIVMDNEPVKDQKKGSENETSKKNSKKKIKKR